jgi:hypothetical protein
LTPFEISLILEISLTEVRPMFSHQEVKAAELAHALHRKSLAELRVLAREQSALGQAASQMIYHRSALLRKIAA